MRARMFFMLWYSRIKFAWRYALAIPMVLLGLFVSMRPAFAQEKSYAITKWQARYEIQTNGNVLVEETQTVKFVGSFSYYGRTIPHRRLDDITDVSVYDVTADQELQEYLDYQVSSTISEGFPATDILLNFALTNAVQTWKISYTVEGGIGFFEDHDEWYWNVIPHDRDVPIGSIEATVVLPKDVGAANIKTALYEDRVADATQEVRDGRTAYFSGGYTGPGTDFTTVVGWPTGVVKNPGIVRLESWPSGADVFVNGVDTVLTTPVGLRLGRELTGPGPFQVQVKKYGFTSEPHQIEVVEGQTTAVKLSVIDTFAKKLLVGIVVTLILLYMFLPLWVGLGLFVHWRRHGKDPKGRGTIIAEYEPPDAATPAVVGTLIDESADLKDITASIIDLAVRGYLLIEELPKANRFTAQDYKLVKRKESVGDATLRSFEVELLDEIFKSGPEKKLSELKTKFYVKIPGIVKKLYAEVVAAGYFETSPDERRKKFTTWTVLTGLVGFIGLNFFGLGVPLLFTAIVIGVFAKLAPKRTEKGVLATEHARGFKLYLDTAERYVVKKMTPETFERFLPYAMVFGIEKKWAEKFKDIYTDREPDWYHSASGTHFNSILLANSLSSWSTAASSAVASRPGGSSGGGGFASGGSGFSGGFSGGGGGGGVRAG